VKAIFAALVLGFSVSLVQAQDSASVIKESSPRLPGVELSEKVAQITGVAISPLLGVSTIGAWTFFKTEPQLRATLPWYCQAWAWGTGLALLCVCFLKDFLGAAAPPLVKMPLDFLELFENKLSALVASAAFVPLVVSASAQVDVLVPQTSNLPPAALGLAMVDGSSWFSWLFAHNMLSVPIGIATFGIVWISAHALNVLVALSPFGIVDAALKLVKLTLISTLLLGFTVHPYAGAVLAICYIVIALFVSGWAYRLTVFGTVMGTDFLLRKSATEANLAEGLVGFLARKINGIPARTMGRIRPHAGGKWAFSYRPWLLLPRRAIEITPNGPMVRKGLINPTLVEQKSANEKHITTFILPPRYRSIESRVAQAAGCCDVVDGKLLKGFRAARQWLVGTLALRKNVSQASI
jgi:hypothetical protein